ncbi:hypothetical protein JOB18_028100 [Solea senegalensis]|uniref:PIH1D1/2/3 CS-like domain-containing protein n=1 Tax=Solea senegalensis TaxID=28829 RepID=A0AAV6PX08_SOLSE|nr:PIH1 domain-containing protein 2 [Solea senegalensis]KAG7479548.1 hypothetical protein JOB18_028100 [Solea senegalensis]
MTSSSSGRDGVLQQVDRFWSMLDDLCENDPAAYSEFIHRNMEEAAGGKAPELVCCLSTRILEPNRGLLYINICNWKRVPAPQDHSQPLPLYAGKLETHTNHSQGSYAILDVAFNPAVLEENKEDRTGLYTLAVKFVQQQQQDQEDGLRLSDHFTVVSSSPNGSRDDLQRRLLSGFQQRSNTSKQLNTDSESPADLLRQISSLRSEKQGNEEELAAQMISKPAEQQKKDFIQVISSTFVPPQKPQHQLQLNTDTAGAPHSVELTVELPKVCSMSECQLRISKDDVVLEVEDVYYLLLEFPKTVNEDTASAVFNKRKRRLVLKVDVL